jgi:hypothetical protein
MEITMTVPARQPTLARVRPRTAPEIGSACVTSLMEAVQAYFDLMYDCDTSRLNDVFYKSSHLQGFRDGSMVSWSMDVYRDILNRRQSPKSLNSPREDEILLIDFASATQAVVKVRVRLSAMVFIDHLTWHRIEGKWLITSKGFHVESDESEG